MQQLKQIPMGWTAKTWQDFKDNLIKANDMQLEVMIKEIRTEMIRREK